MVSHDLLGAYYILLHVHSNPNSVCGRGGTISLLVISGAQSLLIRTESAPPPYFRGQQLYDIEHDGPEA